MPPWVDILHAEKLSYLNLLKTSYGDEVVNDLDDLDPARQDEVETLRHAFQTNVHSHPMPASNLHWAPERILILTTQQCNFRCAHCWLFCAPESSVHLDRQDMDRVFASGLGQGIRSITLSGGEIFLEGLALDTIRKYPVHCIYTNGAWGSSEIRCLELTRQLKEALQANPAIDISRFTIIISFDQIHAAQTDHLACAIANLFHVWYQELPQAPIRLSMALNDELDTSLATLQGELKKRGFALRAHGAFGESYSICTRTFSCRLADGPEAKFFVDVFPVTPVGRALSLPDLGQRRPGAALSLADEPVRLGVGRRTTPQRMRYQYVVGPDGRVTLYEVLFAPPVPFSLGNIRFEPWESVVNRAQRDPVATMCRREGVEAILEIAADHFPELTRQIMRRYTTKQQLLYVLLLNPERRLFLNLVLLKACVSLGYLCVKPEVMPLLNSVSSVRKDSKQLNRIIETAYGKSWGGD